MKNLWQSLKKWWLDPYPFKEKNSNEEVVVQSNWFSAQEELLRSGKEIEPPWHIYPACMDMELGPMWGGWRQGNSEGWIKLIWYPFWNGLSREDRIAYLTKWNASEDWRDYLDPDRESSFAGDTVKDSIAGHVLNLWLKDSKSNSAESTPSEEK